jgi:phage-related protein
MKEVVWVGSSLEDLCEFPEDVQDEIGYALYLAQIGLKAKNAKPLTGIESGIMEIVSDYDKKAYRAVYSIKKRLKDAKRIEKERGE